MESFSEGLLKLIQGKRGTPQVPNLLLRKKPPLQINPWGRTTREEDRIAGTIRTTDLEDEMMGSKYHNDLRDPEFGRTTDLEDELSGSALSSNRNKEEQLKRVKEIIMSDWLESQL